jgi:hypothetical protein
MAIISGSKRFIRSPSCQKVIGELLEALPGKADNQRGYGLGESSIPL